MEIKPGLSLCSTTVESLKAIEYGRACSGEIINYTRYPLIFQGCYVDKGYLNVPFTTIEQGQSEAFAAHKQTGGTTGCYFKFTYRICSKDIYVHVLVSLPFNFNHSVNSLSIAVSKECHSSLSAEKLDNYSKNSHEIPHMQCKEFYSDDSPIIASDGDFCVVGLMGTSHKPRITIKVFPRCNVGLAKHLKSELQEEAQKYHNYIRTKTKSFKREPSEIGNQDGTPLEFSAFYDQLLKAEFVTNKPSLDQDYTVSLVGCIENYTKWDLHLERTQFERGYSSLPVDDISSGKVGWFAYHKHKVGIYGIFAKTTFSVGDLGIFLHIMYSMPYNFNHFANKLSIAVSDSNKMTLKELYKGQRTQYFKRVKFYTKINPLVLSEKGLCIVGVMGTSHQTEVNIKIYSADFGDLNAQVLSATQLSEKAVNEQGYRTFIDNIVEIQDDIMSADASLTIYTCEGEGDPEEDEGDNDSNQNDRVSSSSSMSSTSSRENARLELVFQYEEDAIDDIQRLKLNENISTDLVQNTNV